MSYTLRYIILNCAVAIMSQLIMSQALAAGKIENINGDVNIISIQGELRAAQLGEHIEQGDTIITGKNSTLLIETDDNGLMAVRPKTMLKIEEYRAEGRSSDNILLKLLRGSFRSVTGWVGKKDNRKYHINTPTATIGIRGTDHEPFVIDEGENAGTYDKVNTGGTTLETTFGKIDIAPNQVGFVPKSAKTPPAILPKIPDIYVPAANEQEIDQRKQELESSAAYTLEMQQQANMSSGGGKEGLAKVGSLEDQRLAGIAFDELLRAYEAGNTNFIRNRIDVSMIGYQKFIDDIVLENNQCKQMRVRLLDTQLQAGPDLAVIQTNWEKRCLLLPNFTPRLEQGNSTFLLQKGKNGWYLVSLTADNLFTRHAATTSPGSPTSPTSTTLATLNVTSSLTCSNARPTSPTSLPFTITLQDNDLIGQPSANVSLTGAGGESETINLPNIGGNTFRVTSYNFQGGTPIPNNNIITPNVPPATTVAICSPVTITYTDTTTPAGTQNVSQTVNFPLAPP